MGMLRRNLLNQGEIAMDASFKPRRLRGGEGVSYPRSLYPRTERKSLSDLADEKIVQMIDDCTKIQTEWAERKSQPHLAAYKYQTVKIVQFPQNKYNYLIGMILDVVPDNVPKLRIFVKGMNQYEAQEFFWNKNSDHWKIKDDPSGYKIFKLDDRARDPQEIKGYKTERDDESRPQGPPKQDLSPFIIQKSLGMAILLPLLDTEVKMNGPSGEWNGIIEDVWPGIPQLKIYNSENSMNLIFFWNNGHWALDKGLYPNEWKIYKLDNQEIKGPEY